MEQFEQTEERAVPDVAPVPRQRRSGGGSNRRWTAIAVAVVLLAAIGWLVWNSTSSNKKATTPAVAANPGPVIVPGDQLKGLATRMGHSIYWAGARSNMNFEATFVGRNLYLRYLPVGVPAGSSTPYLTVGTYENASAYTGLVAATHVKGATWEKLKGGSLVVVPAGKPTSAYFAFPGTNLLMEVYDPTPGVALQLVTTGSVEPINP